MRAPTFKGLEIGSGPVPPNQDNARGYAKIKKDINMETLTKHDLSITVIVTDRESLDNQLDAAVSAIRERSTRERRQGILVTRNAVNEFTVALNDSVPFGMTHENHAW